MLKKDSNQILQINKRKLIKNVTNYNMMFSHSKNQSLYAYMLILYISTIPLCVVTFDYNIPVLPITQSRQYPTTYYINYFMDKPNISDPFSSKSIKNWFSLRQDVVRVKLGGARVEDGIVNVYKAKVTQVLDKQSFSGSETGNNLCDVVKVLDNEQGFIKYLFNYHLNKSQTKGEQYFISTAHTSSIQTIKYSNNDNIGMGRLFQGSDGPQLRLFQQRQQNITLYSITNDLHIHKTHKNTKSGNFYKHAFQTQRYYNIMSLQDQKLIKTNTTTSTYTPALQTQTQNIQLELCMTASHKLLHKYKPDNNKYIQILQLDDHVVVKCVSQQLRDDVNVRVNIGVFVVEFNQYDHTWNVRQQSNVDINVQIPIKYITNSDTIYEIIQTKSIQSRLPTQQDHIYIKTLNKIYTITVTNNRLHLQQLILKLKPQTQTYTPQSQYITITPIHIHNPSYDTNTNITYLLIVEKVYGLVIAKYDNSISGIGGGSVNLQVELVQNFNRTIQFADVQSLAYTPTSNIHFPLSQKIYNISNNKYGILEIVVLTGVNKNKQYIVQIVHETKQLQNAHKLTHILHVNKIYHNYNVNTNKGYYFSDRYRQPDPLHPQQNIQQQKQQQQQQQQLQQQQSTYINKIQRILFPETYSQITNNIGIVQMQHKLIYFQYGVPRTLSPQISVGSEMLKQVNYGNIVHVTYVNDTAGKNSRVVNKQMLKQQQIRDKIIQLFKGENNKNITTQLVRNPINEDYLQRIILTLDTYIIILQVNPQKIYHYQYVCNLNSMGVVNQRHKILNDVVIDLEEICEVAGRPKDVLGYCQERQIINFVVDFRTIQEQKDYFIHLLFVVIFCVLISVNLIIVIVFWKSIKRQAQKLMEIRSRKKNKGMFEMNSTTKQQTKTMIQQ